jgi:hypothetical protein
MTVVNIVAWDGKSDWHPGKGMNVVPVEDPIACIIGSTFVGGKWVRPTPPPEPEPKVDPVQVRLAELEREVAALKAAR